MAKRMRPLHQEDVRAKIQTSQLINRLTDHALGKVELTATQVQSIKILIGKTLPDLQAITLDGGLDVDGHHIHTVRREVVRPDNPNS